MTTRYNQIHQAISEYVESLRIRGVYTLYKDEILDLLIRDFGGLEYPSEAEYHAEEWDATDREETLDP